MLGGITSVQPTSVTLDWDFGATAVVSRAVVYYVDVTSSRTSWSVTSSFSTLTGLTPVHTYVFYIEIHSFDKTARSVNSNVTTREFI